MRRGEVWWANLPVPAGRRPVLLLSRDEAYEVRALCMIAPISTRVRGIRGEVALGPRDGLPRPCAANLDSIETIRNARLERRIATLAPEKLAEVNEALHFTLALET